MTPFQGDASEESSEAIQAEIERTRSQLSNKIDRIQERVNPEHLKDQAQDVVRTAVQEGADAVVGYVRGQASDFGGTLFDAMRRNPVPAALIGLGAGWILYESLRGHAKHNGGNARWRTPGYGYAGQFGGPSFSAQSGSTPSAYSHQTSSAGSMSGHEGSGVIGQVRQQAEQVADAVGDKVSQVTGKAQVLGSQVSHLAEQTRHQAQQVGGQAQHLVEANPLSLGLAAFALGAAIGLVLPATRRESQIMGPWRDQVVEKAQTVASDVKRRVEEVVEEVKPELQQVASKVVDDVTQTSKEAVAEVKDAVKQVSHTVQSKVSESTSGSGEEASQGNTSERVS